MTNSQLLLQFLMQIAAILAACRVVGWFASRFLFQPQVVGEMVAGVLLGPSFFGLFAPQAQQYLFPGNAPSMGVLYVLAQVGLVLYMFLVGVEFRVDLFRERFRSAAAVSLAGMIAPFSLGMVLALWLLPRGGLFSSDVSQGEAMLYLGAAMSLTAFPMLARIILERGIAGTRLGTLALSAGAIDDAVAWCVLAIVLASFKADPQIALLAIGGGVAYVLVTTLVGSRVLRPLGRQAERQNEISASALAVILLSIMLAALFTETVGIHAVFGGFVLGAAMPRGKLAAELQRIIGPLTTSFLLPMFFVYSGLNTRIDLVNSWELWGITLAVLGAAITGKLVACGAAARLSGESTRDAFAIGALMNARGLMELIILNIGRERGIITAELFTVMVMMAIVTTLMASPLFLWAYRGRERPA